MRLVPDGVPIRGRILDLQGRPVAGVTVYAREIRVPNSGFDIDAWLASGALYPGGTSSQYRGPTWLGRDGTWTTDNNGRFEVRGVGRDQIVGLEFRCPGLEKVYLYAMAHSSVTPDQTGSRPSRLAGMRIVGHPLAPPIVGASSAN